MLHMSVSSLKDFMTCRRLYYYKRIKKYEKTTFNLPFVVGRVTHEGLGYLLSKKPLEESIKLMTAYYKTEVKKAKEQFILDEKQLKDLGEQEHITKGMLTAYARKYAKMLKDVKHIGSEVEGAVEISENVTFVIKLDNLMRVRAKKILHELKTSKYITPEYVQMVQTDIQTAAYFHIHNFIYEDNKIDEIMYDIIRKPSIRPKKSESYPAYLERLIAWYDKPGDESVFHIERFTKPKISFDDLINTISKVSEDMLRSKTKEDYYQDFDKCASYYGDVCPMYALCHEGGETKENLLMYSVRKPYHVNKENKELKG